MSTTPTLPPRRRLAAFLLAFLVACGGDSERPGDRTSVADETSRAPSVEELRAAVTSDGGRALELDSVVASYYGAAQGGRPIWVRDGELSEAGRTLHDELDRLADEGIHPTLPEAGDPVARELGLSQAFVQAARFLLDGPIDPDSVVDIRVVAESDDEIDTSLLERVAEGRSPAAVFDSLRPELPWYGWTVAALESLRALEASGGWPTVTPPADSLIEPGDSGPAVRSVQARLAAGVDPSERALIDESAPEVYDAPLEEAVRSFQRRHGLDTDGVVGPSTIDALNVPVETRIDDLLRSLGHMRWLPNDLPERVVLVNVAGFEMHVLEKGEIVLGMNVIVGRPDWPTVLFSDTVSHIVLNPYWHVPESIEEAELLPAARADPDYLAENDIEIVREGDSFGEGVDPASVDLSNFDGYNLRGAPGPTNALGRMKFMFPNTHNIYLHDTPADGLFDSTVRAFSHGCVRLERPREFADYLVRVASDQTPSDLNRLLDAQDRAQIDLDVGIPIHLVYLTSWADAEGRLQFHPDIYDRNETFTRILTAQ